MFSFHRKQRSLISVQELEVSEKAEQAQLLVPEAVASDIEILDEDETDVQTPRQVRNLTMIYLLFLAEAIMASSLSAQVAVLVPSAVGCMSMNASFLRSIFESAYFFGSAAGVFWGWTVDRLGRRAVAMVGLAGMAMCCIAMGFATTFIVFAVLRLTAGMLSSAVTVSALAMLADVTHGSKKRVQTVARLPTVAFCGNLGPLAANSIRDLSNKHGLDLFAQFPGLSGQLACASLVGMIALAEALLLEETLRLPGRKPADYGQHVDCEKAAFLGQSLANDSDDSLNITLIEALNDAPSTSPSPRVTFNQLLSAPSLFVLLASYSVLSLHTSTFDILLPHISHTASHDGGMGIPCSWLGTLKLAISFVAAIRILRLVPSVIERVGLLEMYRHMSWVFPAIYLLVPLAGLVLSTMSAEPIFSALTSTIAMLLQAHLAGAAQVVVLLLALSAAPDAQSTGTTIGILSISALYKALAVGASGLSYYLSGTYTMLAVNSSLWAALTVVTVGGALITRQLRETPRVGADIPESYLVWQGVFDAESDEEAGL